LPEDHTGEEGGEGTGGDTREGGGFTGEGEGEAGITGDGGAHTGEGGEGPGEVTLLGCRCSQPCHRACIDEWCRVKGDRLCEICGEDMANIALPPPRWAASN